MIDMMKMGNLISATRREKGFTQDELGSRLGVSAQAISKWERGMSLPDTDMLPDISKILGLSVDYILGITEYNSDVSSIGESTTNNTHTRENPLDYLLADELTIIVSENLFKEDASVITQELNIIMKGIPKLRNEMAIKRGLLIPIVRIIDSVEIPDNSYQILVRGKVVATGSIYVNKYLYICDGKIDESKITNGTPYDEPIAGHKSMWVSAESREEIIKEGGACQSIGDVIYTNFNHTVAKNAALLTHKQTLKAIMENMRTRYPIIVDELIPHKINYDTLHTIIVSLINKGYSIRDMLTICEVISNCVEKTDDIQTIIAEIEKALQ